MDYRTRLGVGNWSLRSCGTVRRGGYTLVTLTPSKELPFDFLVMVSPFILFRLSAVSVGVPLGLWGRGHSVDPSDSVVGTTSQPDFFIEVVGVCPGSPRRVRGTEGRRPGVRQDRDRPRQH